MCMGITPISFGENMNQVKGKSWKRNTIVFVCSAYIYDLRLMRWAGMCKTNPMFFPFKGGDGDLEFFPNSRFLFLPMMMMIIINRSKSLVWYGYQMWKDWKWGLKAQNYSKVSYYNFEFSKD